MNQSTKRLSRLLSAVAVIAAAFSLTVALPATPASAAPPFPQICRDPYLTGVCQNVTTDIPDLNGSVVGDNTVSSVRVPAGWYVVLYEHPDYKGACQDFETDDGWLPASFVGDDTASSVRLSTHSGICGKMTVLTARRGINHLETFTEEYFCPASHPVELDRDWNTSSPNVSATLFFSTTGMSATFTNWNLSGDQSVGLELGCGTSWSWPA